MACLAELSVQGQTAGGFAIYAQRLGLWAGFITGWRGGRGIAQSLAAEGAIVAGGRITLMKLVESSLRTAILSCRSLLISDGPKPWPTLLQRSSTILGLSASL
jgi:hypothetical protein